MSSNWLQSTYLETARTLVAGTFRYRFEEIDEWDQGTFFKRLAAAEFLVGKNLEPADPNAKPVSKQDAMQSKLETQKHQKKEIREFLRRKVESRR